MRHNLKEPSRTPHFEGRTEIPCLNMVLRLQGASAEV